MYKYIVVPTNGYTPRQGWGWDNIPIENLLLLELTIQFSTYNTYEELRSIKHPIGWPRLSDYTICTYCTYDNEFVIKNLLYFNTLEELERFILYKTL